MKKRTRRRTNTRKRKNTGKVPGIISLLLIVAALLFGFGQQTTEDLTIHFLDVGQADAAILQYGDEVMMIDGGNKADSSLVYAYLRDTLGIRHIDYMIATHPHEDHIGGLLGALNACTVGRIYSPVTTYNSSIFRSLTEYAQKQGLQLTVPRVGDILTFGDAQVQFLSPARTYDETNNKSIVVRIVHGRNTFLFTGDAEWEAEHDMVNAGYDLSARVLKVGHHGSDTSSSYVFLREVMPEYAVISCGTGNSYGHPSSEILSRLRDTGATVYRTDLQGGVVCISDGTTLSFEVGGQTMGEQAGHDPINLLRDLLEDLFSGLSAYIPALGV